MEKIELMALSRARRCIDRIKGDDLYNMIVEGTIEMNQECRLKFLQKVGDSLNRIDVELKEAKEWLDCIIEKQN